MSPDLVVVLAIAAIGAIGGSAVTAIAYRVPRHISWVHGRSACPSCSHTLGVLDLVPILSWVVSLGRCRHCHARIPWRYPVTELACAAWAVLLYRKVGLDTTYPFLALWGFLLIALTWIDLDYQLLPDVLTFPGTLIGLAAALQWDGGVRHAWMGAAAGAGLLWLLAWGYWFARRAEGMGGGDIKLAAMFGVVLGWQLSLGTLFLAALAGSIWGVTLMLRGQAGGRTALPFGTLLAPAAMVVYLWGDRWLGSYLSLFRSH